MVQSTRVIGFTAQLRLTLFVLPQSSTHVLNLPLSGLIRNTYIIHGLTRPLRVLVLTFRILGQVSGTCKLGILTAV